MINIYSYRFSIILLSSIILGGVTGYFWGEQAIALKPLGDIFLNLMFTIISPLIFFSVSSAISNISNMSRIIKIFFGMFITFLFTGIIAAIFMLIIVILFPPAQDVAIKLTMPSHTESINLSNQIVSIFTVTDFTKLFLPENMLALIFFSILVGLTTAMAGEKTASFTKFLQAGSDIFLKLVSLIMCYAPIGFFAFFAVLASQPNSKLFESYFRTTLIYYPFSLLYFIAAYTFFAYLAGKMHAVKSFWQHILPPAITALATCSSAASMPINLESTKKMRVSPEIYETVIPIGTMIHKDGSIMGGVIKIAFLFGVFHMDLLSMTAILTAMLISLLVGTVMGAIPSGGLLGEMLILSMYGFPKEALLLIAAISIIIDPLATMLNVSGNTISSLLVARLVEGKNWWQHKSD